MPARLHIVVRDIPGQDFDPGQVITPGKDKAKHLHLRLIRPLAPGTVQVNCPVCDQPFISGYAMSEHQDKRHGPQQDGATAALPVTPEGPPDAGTATSTPTKRKRHSVTTEEPLPES